MNRQRQAADADHLFFWVHNFYFPNVYCLSDIDWTGGAGNEAFVHAADMVGVYLNTYDSIFLLVNTKQTTYASEGFCQYAGGATMQQAKGLHGSVVNGHGAFDIVISDFGNRDAEMVAYVFAGENVRVFERGFYFPNH